jgi:hypothetical protein
LYYNAYYAYEVKRKDGRKGRSRARNIQNKKEVNKE